MSDFARLGAGGEILILLMSDANSIHRLEYPARWPYLDTGQGVSRYFYTEYCCMRNIQILIVRLAKGILNQFIKF